MPRAIQTIAGFTTAAGAGTNIVTPAAGDTFAVPSLNPGTLGRLNNLWAKGAVADFIRVRSPRMHDPNQGIRVQIGTTQSTDLLPWEVSERLYSSDTPTVEIDSTGAGSSVILAIYDYDDMPGVNPRLASLADIQSRVIHISGTEVDVTSGAIGTWGAGVALNANFDNFEAGADYALLGYTCSVACAGIAITGQDTSGLKTGGPGIADPYRTSRFFLDMAELTGRACIPIIAANNKQSTLLQNIDNAAATATKVTLFLGQLG